MYNTKPQLLFCQQKMKQQSVMSQIWMHLHPLTHSHESHVLARVQYKELRIEWNVALCLPPPKPIEKCAGLYWSASRHKRTSEEGQSGAVAYQEQLRFFETGRTSTETRIQPEKRYPLMLDFNGETLITARPSERYEVLTHPRRWLPSLIHIHKFASFPVRADTPVFPRADKLNQNF